MMMKLHSVVVKRFIDINCESFELDSGNVRLHDNDFVAVPTLCSF